MSAPAPVPTPADDRATLARLTRGMRLVAATLPHLSGLAAAARVVLDDGVPTMGVFASGRLVANRDFTARLSNADLVFVLAHELLHLALRTHDRAVGSGALEFNYAHDYIINDMLRHALGVDAIPAGGLDMALAREKSAEEIVLDMRRNEWRQAPSQVWEGVIVTLGQAMAAGRAAPGAGGDVLSAGREREMFPQDSEDQTARARAMRDLALRGLAMARALELMKGRGDKPGGEAREVRALRGVHRAPWQVAMQRWLEGAAPGERTFQRASRRGAEREDVVLPGRHRKSLMLNVVLDTSGSMELAIAFALGAIADFCEATGVDDIRVVQCDTTVTADDMVGSAELAQYEVRGYGGSDLTPALALLAADPRVQAAIVITDGAIDYPSEAPPYAVLWAVPEDATSFSPPYGQVVCMGAPPF